MTLNFWKFIFSFLTFILFVLLIHLILLWFFPQFISISLTNLLIFYLFLFSLNMGHFLSLRWIMKQWPRYAGLLFTALSMVKMLFSIIFLWPFIIPNHLGAIPYALNFITVYLFLLGFEVVFLAKSLMKNS